MHIIAGEQIQTYIKYIISYTSQLVFLLAYINYARSKLIFTQGCHHQNGGDCWKNIQNQFNSVFDDNELSENYIRSCFDIVLNNFHLSVCKELPKARKDEQKIATTRIESKWPEAESNKRMAEYSLPEGTTERYLTVNGLGRCNS